LTKVAFSTQKEPRNDRNIVPPFKCRETTLAFGSGKDDAFTLWDAINHHIQKRTYANPHDKN